MKILIIGNARHGKDTVAEMLNENFGITHKSSSQAAADIFIYDVLKDKYGYKTPEECFSDRVNHRGEWYDLICEYNKDDKAALARAILEDCDMYVGMRSSEEIQACMDDRMFDLIIGVFNPSLPLEPSDSFSIDLWKESDFIIPNAGTLEQLEEKVVSIFTEMI